MEDRKSLSATAYYYIFVYMFVLNDEKLSGLRIFLFYELRSADANIRKLRC